MQDREKKEEHREKNIGLEGRTGREIVERGILSGAGCSKKAADAQREGRSKKHW